MLTDNVNISLYRFGQKHPTRHKHTIFFRVCFNDFTIHYGIHHVPPFEAFFDGMLDSVAFDQITAMPDPAS